MTDKKLSLYAIEQDVGECKTGLKGQGHHAYLALVDETDGDSPKIVEELHFIIKMSGLSDGQRPYLHAVTKPGGRSMAGVTLIPSVGGDVDNMQEIWNRAVMIGTEISELELPFVPQPERDAINCRAGVKAVLETLGLSFMPAVQCENAHAGVESNIQAQLPENLRFFTP